MEIHVQLDESEEKVVSYFASEQDADKYPGQSVIETSDARWLEYYSRVGGNSLGLPVPSVDDDAREVDVPHMAIKA